MALVCIAFLYQWAGLVDLPAVTRKGRKSTQNFCKIASCQLGFVPREHAGREGFGFSRKGVICPFDDLILLVQFLSAVKPQMEIQRLLLFGEVPQLGDSGGLRHKRRQPDRQHVFFFIMQTDHQLGNLICRCRLIQIGGKIACHQQLMVRALGDDLLHLLDGHDNIVKTVAPQSGVNFHRILGCKALYAPFFAFQTFYDQAHALFADPIQISRIVGDDAQPSADGTLDRGEANQSVVCNDLQQSQKGVLGTTVSVFANGLAQSFLQSCRKQELAQQLVELLAMAAYDAADQCGSH